MRKGLELTGFDGQKLSNEEKIQPNVTGVGGDKTVQGTSIDRSKVLPLYEGYYSEKTYRGAIACLNVIYNKAIPNFPTSDRSRPSSYVVLYPVSSGSIGGTMPVAPLTFHSKEWVELVKIIKDYKDSAFINSLVNRRDYISALQHLEKEVVDKYETAKLIPNT